MSSAGNNQTNFILRLEQIIAERKAQRPAGSYTVSLLEGGIGLLAGKLCEEAGELIQAAAAGRKKQIVAEAADLVYHLLVLLADNNVRWNEVVLELERRHKG